MQFWPMEYKRKTDEGVHKSFPLHKMGVLCIWVLPYLSMMHETDTLAISIKLNLTLKVAV